MVTQNKQYWRYSSFNLAKRRFQRNSKKHSIF